MRDKPDDGNRRGYGFGTFAGVFTPSILTIIGVVMYLRFGWVLGNLGLGGTLFLVTLCTSITFVTGLSISALATNMRMKGGGAYFILSRSLGLEAGAALGVPLALENMPGDTWELLDVALARYPQTGICYDCGHGNDDRFKHNEEIHRRRARLFALHLNDNDGVADQHQSPFMGTVDWKRVAEVIADSPYDKPLSYEICMKATPYQHGPLTAYPSQTPEDQRAFLEDAHERCERFGRLYEEIKRTLGR